MPKEFKASVETLELILEPIPPDSVATIKAELMPRIEAALKESNKQDFLKNGELVVDVEKTFPVDQLVIALVSGVAVKTFEVVVLPEIRKWVKVKIKRRSKNKQSKGA